MTWITIMFAIIWVYVITVCKRSNLFFWEFVLGSVGLFVFMLIWLEPVVVAPLQKSVAAVAGVIGSLTGIFDSFFQNGMLFIQHGGDSLSLYIDFECSGVIEMMAFLALLWFFPVYKFHERIIVSLLGIAAIFVTNVLRIVLICVLVYIFGEGIYFYAHTVYARIFFYFCTILLYFLVFTKSHIIRQKVGAFSYDIND